MMQEISPGIYQMDSFERGIAGRTACFVIRDGRHAAIVETGTGSTVERWLAALDQLRIDRTMIHWILVSHIHLDHAGAAGALLQHLPNARIGVHPKGARHLVDPSRLLAGARDAWGDEFDQLGGMVPAPPERLASLEDNAPIDVGEGRLLSVLHTPGHAPHHMSFYDPQSRGVFVGDAAGNSFAHWGVGGQPMVFAAFAPPIVQPGPSLASIYRLIALRPRTLYFTHFGRVEPGLAVLERMAGQTAYWFELAREVIGKGGTAEDLAAAMLEHLIEGMLVPPPGLQARAPHWQIGTELLIAARSLEAYVQQLAAAP